MQDTRLSICFSRSQIAAAVLGLFALSGCSMESARLDDGRGQHAISGLQYHSGLIAGWDG